MARTLVDCRFDALRAEGFTGSTSDMLMQYWTSLGGTGGTLVDLHFSALEALGRTEGTLMDRWFTYLGALGYEGSIRDKEYAYWCDILDGILPTGALTTNG